MAQNRCRTKRKQHEKKNNEILKLRLTGEHSHLFRAVHRFSLGRLCCILYGQFSVESQRQMSFDDPHPCPPPVLFVPRMCVSTILLTVYIRCDSGKHFKKRNIEIFLRPNTINYFICMEFWVRDRSN